MKRILAIIGAVLVVGVFVAQVRTRQTKNRGLATDLTAVGLRGTSKITKPLSAVQKERLEKQFLERPPAAHVSPNQFHQSPGGTITEIQTLNEFNKRQKS